MRHERTFKYKVCVTAQEMRVCWSLGVGLQEQASNHLKLLWSKAMVVSVEEKAWQKTVSGMDQGDERKRTADEVSKIKDDVKTGGYLYTRISPGATCLLPGRRPA